MAAVQSKLKLIICLQKGGSAPGSAGMPYMMDFWNKYTVIEIYNAKDCLHMVQ